jgi:hypothetical protein
MGAPEWMHQDQEISPNFAATVQVRSGQLENSQLPTMGLPTTLQILIRERIRRSDIPTRMELDGFRFARQNGSRSRRMLLCARKQQYRTIDR